ncbi:MAG: MFS transporter [Clostridia bacterium]|nr:MFS transporter [Clostridia bacterium]
MNDQIFRSPDYSRSRWAYTLECAFEYFVALMVADAFLANLLSHMQIPDAVIGIISSLIALAFLFQLAAIFVAQRITNVKKVAILIHCIGQMFFLLLYLLPFLPIPAQLRTVAVIACVLFGYFGNYLVVSVIFKWGNSFVNPNRRANFAGTKEMISLLAGTVVSLGVGHAVDSFTEAGNVTGGFLFIACMMLVFNLGDFICLMLMKNQTHERVDRAQVTPFWQVVKQLLTNKSFVCVVILGTLIQASTYMTMGFMGVYKTKDLLLSVGAVQLINIAGCLARFLLTKPFAAYADKRSYVKGIRLGMIIALIAFVINMFTTPHLWWLVIIFTLVINVSYAGTAQNMMNIVYSYVDSKYFVEASAIKNSISGLCGFGASILGGLILDAVQANGNQLFGMTMYGQQLLSAISALILIGAILFSKLVLEKKPIIAK